MENFTTEANDFMQETASQYNLSLSAVEQLASAIIRGNGRMAQFNIPELGGSGQWMYGGMTMVGDMFNNSLKTKVDAVCTALSKKIQNTPFLKVSDQTEDSIEENTAVEEWPAIFGKPAASGSQNNFRYAYFPTVKRLVIDQLGERTIYDTKHHIISGISQQQGHQSSAVFQSQDGEIQLSSFDIIALPKKSREDLKISAPTTEDILESTQEDSAETDIFKTIEKLGQLHKNGLINDEEYQEKKKELLSRI